MGLNFATLGENTYTVTFDNLLCSLLAVQAKCSCSPSLQRRSLGAGLTLAGGFLSGGMAIPVPPLERGDRREREIGVLCGEWV